MESKMELSADAIREARDIAEALGYLLMREKPGYDQIGQKGEAYVVDRATGEPKVVPCRIIERDGRPYVRPKWPKDSHDYYIIGWRVKK